MGNTAPKPLLGEAFICHMQGCVCVCGGRAGRCAVLLEVVCVSLRGGALLQLSAIPGEPRPRKRSRTRSHRNRHFQDSQQSQTQRKRWFTKEMAQRRAPVKKKKKKLIIGANLRQVFGRFGADTLRLRIKGEKRSFVGPVCVCGPKEQKVSSKC